MRMMCSAVVWVVCAQVAATSAAGPASVFTKKPTATRAGESVTIAFAVASPTDVEVAILNRQGKVVRHLTAGVIGGKNASPEPLKPGLAQELVWDGKDDFGKKAQGGPFRLRVSAGMKPVFDGFLMYQPAASGRIVAVAVGPGGRLYAFHADGTANYNMGGHKIKVYGRDGAYEKALTPFPADIAPERVKALGVFQTPEGDLVPRVHNYETLSFYPDTIGYRGREMPECSSPAVDSKGRVYWLVKGPVLLALDADGGVPYETFLGPRLLADVKDLRAANEYLFRLDGLSLTMSGDERYVYFAGLGTGELHKPKTFKSLPCVYRVSVKTRGPAEVFLGKADQPGGGKGLLTAPRGLAVAKGLLYVADPGADRVVAFKESDRSVAGEIKVKNPQSVGVDPTTGAVYVCVYTGKQTADLIKFDSLASGEEVCRLALPKTGWSPNVGIHRIAVDASAKPTLIWLPCIPYSPHPLLCIEDAGDRFVVRGDPRNLKGPWAEGPRDLTVDRLRDELYIKANGQRFYRFDEKTGAFRDMINLARYPRINTNAHGTQLIVGTDGNLYTNSWGAGLWRLDRQGKPLNWDGRDSHIIPISGIMCFQERHLALKPYAPMDEFYLVPPGNYKNPKARGWPTVLNVFGQDGKVRRTVIWGCLHGAVPRLDAKGNIYLGDMVKPADRSYPAFFDGKLKPPPKQARGGDRFWYSYMYASIIKFPPSGGAIWYGKDVPASADGKPPAKLLAQPKVPMKAHLGYAPHGKAELQGALWYRFGFSPYSCHTSGMTMHCMCEGVGFDVDPFGRVFYPNLGQFRVEVVDTNNNWIRSFGKYGNQDSGGPNAKVRKPEIPLAWPCYVAVSDTHAYVADTVNRRVVKVRLDWAAQETCEVK